MEELRRELEEIRDSMEIKFTTYLFIIGIVISYAISQILYQIS